MEILRDRLSEPTSRGLADAVNTAIRDGLLVGGDKLPPIRTLSRSLRLSPTTVSAAWSVLARSGAIHTDGRRGTVVAGLSVRGPHRYRRALQHNTVFDLDLSTGLPDPALLPDLGPALRSVPRHRTPRTYLDDAFLPDLLEILRLDWPYTAERMSIVDGAMDAQDQIASSLLRYGDRVAVEHPTFPPLIDLLESLGARIVGVPVDTDGIVPDRLAAAIASGADTVFLQTRAQNPTGASLTSQRLEQLASVLKGTDVVAVEDDSAGAISSSRALSLGSYLPQQTIHVRSFSKSHGPDLRLAALSGPSRLVDPITERRRLGQGWTSLLLQSVLLDLLVRPSAVAQVERARATYARRRSALVDALARFGVPIDGRDGLNVWLPVRDESAALIRLAERGIGAAAGTPFSAIHSSEGHLRITAGLIPNRGYEHIAAELTEAATAGARTEPR